jgi:hypothetical protein
MRWGWALGSLALMIVASCTDGGTGDGDEGNAGGTGGDEDRTAGDAGTAAGGRGGTVAGENGASGAPTGTSGDGGSLIGSSGATATPEPEAGGQGGVGDGAVACSSKWNEPYSCEAGTYCRRRGNDEGAHVPDCVAPYSQADDGESECLCVEMPAECDASDVRPVCASNGQVFANACEMRLARRDYPALWHEVKCPETTGEEWLWRTRARPGAAATVSTRTQPAPAVRRTSRSSAARNRHRAPYE